MDYILQSLPGRQDSQGNSASRSVWWLADCCQDQGLTFNPKAQASPHKHLLPSLRGRAMRWAGSGYPLLPSAYISMGLTKTSLVHHTCGCLTCQVCSGLQNCPAQWLTAFLPSFPPFSPGGKHNLPFSPQAALILLGPSFYLKMKAEDIILSLSL